MKLGKPNESSSLFGQGVERTFEKNDGSKAVEEALSCVWYVITRNQNEQKNRNLNDSFH